MNFPIAEKDKVYRKAVLSDFITDTSKTTTVLDNSHAIQFEKSKSYRIQGEFGE
jgi:hypothetical protein